MSLENEILKEYLAATHQVSRQFREHYGRMNLTFPQAMVLSLLETEGPMPISALAEQTGSANSTISGVVDRLERMNLVERKRSEMDRRVIYVEPTNHYQSLKEQISANVSEYFGGILKNASEEEQQKILDSLKLLTNLLKDPS